MVGSVTVSRINVFKISNYFTSLPRTVHTTSYGQGKTYMEGKLNPEKEPVLMYHIMYSATNLCEYEKEYLIFSGHWRRAFAIFLPLRPSVRLIRIEDPYFTTV